MTRVEARERAAEMYELYQAGLSLAEVGAVYGVSRQTVYGALSARGLKLRTRVLKPFVEYQGGRYTPDRNGYYRLTTSRPKTILLHRRVWEDNHGPIPAGWDVHHVDEDKSNNDISNLECLPKAEHTRLYSPHNNQFTRGRRRSDLAVPVRHCAACGAELVKRESRAAFLRRRHCNSACAYESMRGRPRAA